MKPTFSRRFYWCCYIQAMIKNGRFTAVFWSANNFTFSTIAPVSDGNFNIFKYMLLNTLFQDALTGAIGFVLWLKIDDLQLFSDFCKKWKFHLFQKKILKILFPDPSSGTITFTQNARPMGGYFCKLFTQWGILLCSRYTC